MHKNLHIITLSACVLFVLMSVWMIYYVPMNLDEALPYHVLACIDHPNYVWQTFIDGCDQHYALTTPWGFTYPRPYGYVGLADSALYAPIYYLFHSPVAQLWYGLGLFILFCVLLSRLTRNPSLSLPFFLCFFPLAYQFVHDTGPIKIAALAFPLSAMMYVKACRSSRVTQALLGFLQAVLFLLATEEKIFFLYLVAAIGLFSLAIAQDRRGEQPSDKKPAISWIYIMVTLSLFMPGLALHLLSTMSDGKTYMIALQSMTGKSGMPFVVKKLVLYSLYWPSYAHRNYVPKHWPLMRPFGIATVCFVAACFYVSRKRQNAQLYPRFRSLLLAASVLSIIILFLITQNAWAGHHFVFLWIPLMIMFGDLLADLDKAVAARLAAVFVALNFLSVLAVMHMKLEKFASWDRAKITAYFNKDDRPQRAMLNTSGFGIYFPISLYAKKDSLITNQEILDPMGASQVLEVSQKTGRTLYETCFERNCTAPILEQEYGGKVHFQEQNIGLTKWHLFKASAPE